MATGDDGEDDQGEGYDVSKGRGDGAGDCVSGEEAGPGGLGGGKGGELGGGLTMIFAWRGAGCSSLSSPFGHRILPADSTALERGQAELTP